VELNPPVLVTPLGTPIWQPERGQGITPLRSLVSAKHRVSLHILRLCFGDDKLPPRPRTNYTLVQSWQAQRIGDLAQAILGVVAEQPWKAQRPGVSSATMCICPLPSVALLIKCVEGQTGVESSGGVGELNRYPQSTGDKLHCHFFRSFSKSYNQWFSAGNFFDLRSLHTTLLQTHRSQAPLSKPMLDEDPLSRFPSELLSPQIPQASRLYQCSTTPLPILERAIRQRLDQRYGTCVEHTLDNA
jgi:hypothetical protein